MKLVEGLGTWWAGTINTTVEDLRALCVGVPHCQLPLGRQTLKEVPYLCRGVKVSVPEAQEGGREGRWPHLL